MARKLDGNYITANTITVSKLSGPILPSWDSNTRPSSPSNGSIGFNTTLGIIEYYSGANSSWQLVNRTAGYSANLLIVGGGGGGGSGEGNAGGDGGGGGGGGGLVYQVLNLIPGVSYSIVVGAGGTFGNISQPGSVGTNSSFDNLIAYGGGGGGSGDGAGSSSGGSGGGAGNAYGTETYGGGCIPSQGFPGGDSTANNTTFRGGSGGGGAGGRGFDRNSNVGANGAYGLGVSITNSMIYYAGGGAGGGNGLSAGGIGGNTTANNKGGGGNGANSTIAAVAGTANLGGGGGGGVGHNVANTYVRGASGGSGVVIISYASATQKANGGTVTSYSAGGTNNWVHTFTTSGTLTA